MPDRVRHYKQVHCGNVFHLNFEHSINTSYQTIWVVFQVLEVFWQNLEIDIQFMLIHGFDDEFVVVREKEEAARFSLTFTSFKYLIPIEFGRH